jgi:hypothetical protein
MTPHELPKITHESALKSFLRKRKMLRQVDGFAKGAGKGLPTATVPQARLSRQDLMLAGSVAYEFVACTTLCHYHLYVQSKRSLRASSFNFG